ncbi:MAG: tRNA lysidine(34) synthetase TilS [Candidatus Latescibacterota bacterium]
MPHSLVLIAVSGGPDSICLLHVLHALRTDLPFDIHIAHLNHQLRPEAQTDADFVVQTANNLAVPITLGTANIRILAKKEKRSIEDAARQARRRFLLETAHHVGATRIALGHTENDQAETILFRLLRGTSLTGLSGIRPKTDNLWIRPLLETTRTQVETFVAHHKISFVQDASNTDLRYARNKIRHQLIPHIKTHYTPQIASALTRLGTLAQDDDNLLQSLSENAFQKATLYSANRKIILDVKQIFGYHISLRRRLLKKALFELGISENAVTFVTMGRLLEGLNQNHTRIQISADISAHHVNGLFILAKPTSPFQVPICLLGNTPFPIQNARILAKRQSATNTLQVKPNDAYSVFFDADQLPSSLYIRQVQAGDRFQPFGFSGTQKVNKLLVEHKIPHPLRSEVPVLVGDNQILWVLGLRRSNHAPITPKTKHIQKLMFEGGWQRLITHPETR